MLAPAVPRLSLRPSARVPTAASEALPEMRVSMFVVRPLVDIIARAGVPRREILLASGLSDEALSEADTAVPRQVVERICELALRPGIAPALGLHWLQYLTVHTFGPVSHALMHTGSLRHALELVLRYETLFCDHRIFALEEEGETATLRLVDWNVRSPSVLKFMTEMIIAGFSSMVTAYGARIDRVRFAHPTPHYVSEYTRTFGLGVDFDQAFTGIEFPRAHLDRRNPHFDAEVCAAIADVLERRLIRATQEAPYAVRVREILTQQSPTRLNIDAAARKLGLSERSLRRRLAAEGISFRAIQESVLTSLAHELLRERRFTIKEAAHAMGFSDASAFHRAFKRWTGRTPSSLAEQP